MVKNMNHKDNYRRVQNTLGLISTKGNDTLIMADCLKFLEQCIRECEQGEANTEAVEVATE